VVVLISTFQFDPGSESIYSGLDWFKKLPQSHQAMRVMEFQRQWMRRSDRQKDQA
jgi:hypothetical protein